MKQSETDKWLEDEKRSLNYRLERVDHELKLTKEVMDSVDPYDIRINNLEIRILGDNESRVKITKELLEFEDEIRMLLISDREKIAFCAEIHGREIYR